VVAKRFIVTSLAGCALLTGACTERASSSIEDAAPDERNQLLLQAIKDAGYLCEQVIDATAPSGGGGSAWRVLCNDMLVYIASLDAAGAVHIEPIPYGDPARVVAFPESRDPDQGAETRSPDP
jgi:hypothetical protein